MNILRRPLSAGGDDGIRSQRELRALVAVGSNSPPDCYSLPPLFESLNSHFQGIPLRYFLSHGGDDGIRTHDPLLAGQVLSQLSYTPRLFLGFCCFSVFHFCEAKISSACGFHPLVDFIFALRKFHRNPLDCFGRPKWTRTTD